MLDIFYNSQTKEVIAWTTRLGTRQARLGETHIQLDIGVPTKPNNAYEFNELMSSLDLKAGWKPKLTTIRHLAVVDSFNVGVVKPLTVKRTYEETEYTVDCYVSQDLVDLYPAYLQVGDYVIVDFIDGDLTKPFASQKVYKSW